MHPTSPRAAKQAFSARLQFWMNQRHLNQARLAAISGVSQPTLSHLINCEEDACRATVLRLAVALEIGEADLCSTSAAEARAWVAQMPLEVPVPLPRRSRPGPTAGRALAHAH